MGGGSDVGGGSDMGGGSDVGRGSDVGGGRDVGGDRSGRGLWWWCRLEDQTEIMQTCVLQVNVCVICVSGKGSFQY